MEAVHLTAKLLDKIWIWKSIVIFISVTPAIQKRAIPGEFEVRYNIFMDIFFYLTIQKGEHCFELLFILEIFLKIEVHE